MAKTILVLILILAAGLRTVGLSSHPPGFTPDEAGLGYNAYSLLLTGRDEWGTVWWQLPVTNLQSFGDYKLPLYSFLAVPTIKIFGLNEFAVRLPNAILGTLSILAVFLLGSRIGGSRIGLLSATLMAISPWSIQMSRGAFEANLVSLFVPLAIYAYLSSRFIQSAIFFVLGVYTYHSAKILTPLILVALFVYKPTKKIAFFMILGVLLIPALISQIGLGGSRSSDLLIFKPTDNWEYVSARRFAARSFGVPDTIARVFSNKLTYVATTWFENYASYLSPQFLFTNGPSEGTYGMLRGRGVLYRLDLIAICIFVAILIKNPTRKNILLTTLIFLSFLPASLTKGAGLAANRTVIALPFIAIALAIGVGKLSMALKPAIYIVMALYCLSLVYFAYDYVYFAKTNMGQDMHIGKKELFERTMPIAAGFNQIKFSRTLSNPHIFFAFFTATPPTEYQKAIAPYKNLKNHGVNFVDQLSDYSIGKYHFGDSLVEKPVSQPTLFVGKPDQFDSISGEYFHIDYPNGTEAYRVVEKKP